MQRSLRANVLNLLMQCWGNLVTSTATHLKFSELFDGLFLCGVTLNGSSKRQKSSSFLSLSAFLWPLQGKKVADSPVFMPAAHDTHIQDDSKCT